MKLLLLACLLAVAQAHRDWEYPAVAPLQEGTYQPGLTTIAALGSADAPCPAGFAASTKPEHLEMGADLLESWFVKYAMPDLIAKNVAAYACTRGPKCEQTRYVSVCAPKTTTAGQPANIYAQGIVLYRCNNQVVRGAWEYKKVGIFAAKGAFIADTTEGGLLGGTTVPAVAALPASNALQKGKYKVNAGQTIPDITCPNGYQRRSNWGNIDQEDTMARKLVDDFFTKIALPQLRKAGNPYGCPFGAKFVDGDPFFGAQVKDTTTKHTHTSSCFQKNPPAKGKTAIMYAQGIINYYCLDKNGKKSGTYKYVAVYTAAGAFIQPK
ncbi:hypothetical protein COHA_009677 [Chlorella ohadii]|uniref:Uncharacterized protein n=1 Tax=Chlorella ohadii TaxID=2649997 RepID=A0AAD5DJ32_9CHLO|nr:hypothetical protein COHA_009677 [Chlorella ohadii]